MACGTPVVASKVGGLAFNVQDGRTGFLVPERDPAALADRIRLLLSNPELRQELGSEAIRWVSHYSWASVAGRILEVYESALPVQRQAAQVSRR
jgi:D-inositol-3-phosphate glycosyltransferase